MRNGFARIMPLALTLVCVTASLAQAPKPATLKAQRPVHLTFKSDLEEADIAPGRVVYVFRDMEFRGANPNPTKIVTITRETADITAGDIDLVMKAVLDSKFLSLSKSEYGVSADQRYYEYEVFVDTGLQSKRVIYRSGGDDDAPPEFKAAQAALIGFAKKITKAP